jgi:CheY-like chemotaxis protein
MAISGNANLAIADLPPDHPVQQSLAEIAKAGSRATDLVRRILTFSRPSEIKRQVIDLRPVIEEALKLVRATLPATIEFRTAFAPNLSSVLADSTQIHQIIVNLATNAAHAIGNRSDGAIEIRLGAAKLTHEDANPLLNLPDGNYIRMDVSDNGCGMDRATLDRIFDPFFTTKGPGEGTGLGLAVVHGIMKNHDGGIAVYSEPGRGTAFRLFFPAAATTASKVQDAPSPKKHECTENILYVDDEEALVMFLTRTLQRRGYKVTGETDPVRAIELFRSNPQAYDAVITDMTMPQLTGFDLVKQVLAIRPGIPIIMTSGFVRHEDEERALKMGVRYVILKPDTSNQMGRALERIFRHKS